MGVLGGDGGLVIVVLVVNVVQVGEELMEWVKGRDIVFLASGNGGAAEEFL